MTTPDVRNLDPFDAPVPGEGMTAPKESRVWEKPAQFSKPKDAIDFVVGKIDSDESTKDALGNIIYLENSSKIMYYFIHNKN